MFTAGAGAVACYAEEHDEPVLVAYVEGEGFMTVAVEEDGLAAGVTGGFGGWPWEGGGE